jgi:TRAP-type uncharacterized transport system fused permease subunit
VFVIAVGFSCFQVYTAAFGLLPAQLQRSIHLAFAFVLVFLLFPFRTSKYSDRLKWHNYLVAAFAGLVGLYVTLNYMRIMESGGDYATMDYIFAGLGILCTLEAARRVVGLPIVCIASVFLIYAYLGSYFPGFLGHRGYSLKRIASHMYLTTEGIMGIPLWVSSTFIYLFVLFGAFREKTGLGQLFIDLSNSVAGWASGGPAKVAVVPARSRDDLRQFRGKYRGIRQLYHSDDESSGTGPSLPRPWRPLPQPAARSCLPSWGLRPSYG